MGRPRLRAYVATSNQEHCPVCGQAMRDHPHCRVCHIGVGPGHIETQLTDGVCDTCAAFATKHSTKEEGVTIPTKRAEVNVDLPLTARHLEILRLAADGYGQKEVGRRMGISQQTVKNHCIVIFAKMRVQNITQAVATALREGMIE